MPVCNNCNATFADFHELAIHISSSNKGHRRGKKWAAKYLMLKGKRDAPRRAPKAEVSQETKDSLMRTLSGQKTRAVCVCPKCKVKHQEALPVEYAEGMQSWRIGSNLAILCHGDRGRAIDY